MINYCLVRDEDCHWYVIPSDKQNQFEKMNRAIAEYWGNLSDDDHEDVRAPELPDWAIEVGGSPSLVEFPSYVIR